MGVRNKPCEILSCSDNFYNRRTNFFSSWWSLICEVAGSESSYPALKKALKTQDWKLSEMVVGRSGQVRNVPADFLKAFRVKIEWYRKFTRQELESVAIIVHYYENLSFVPKWTQVSRSVNLIADGKPQPKFVESMSFFLLKMLQFFAVECRKKPTSIRFLKRHFFKNLENEDCSSSGLLQEILSTFVVCFQ